MEIEDKIVRLMQLGTSFYPQTRGIIIEDDPYYIKVHLIIPEGITTMGSVEKNSGMINSYARRIIKNIMNPDDYNTLIQKGTVKSKSTTMLQRVPSVYTYIHINDLNFFRS